MQINIFQNLEQEVRLLQNFCNIWDFWDFATTHKLIQDPNYILFYTQLLSTINAVSLFQKNSESADLLYIFVEKNCRQQGVAEQLLKHSMLHLFHNNIERVLLEVKTSNTQAQNLYTKLGFTKIHQRKKYYSNGEDALIYCKERTVDEY